jgi:hypothetical protein
MTIILITHFKLDYVIIFKKIKKTKSNNQQVTIYKLKVREERAPKIECESPESWIST